MGIPTYFRSILKENINIVECANKNKESIDALFFDFNALIYTVFAKYEFTGELELIENIIREVEYIVKHVVKPSHTLYIAIDGTAPRAKMVQQRSRRYKSVMLDKILKEKGKITRWNPSNNICPGTRFMKLFHDKLLESMNRFKGVQKIYYDGCYRPGEGEHKILPHLRQMKMENPEMKVVIFSPDNDILSLSMLSGKKHVKILRYMDIYCLDILKKKDKSLEKYESKIHEAPMIYIDMDNFWNNFSKTMSGSNPENTLLDYNFLLSMVGNDFVPSLPFMKIRSGGLEFLLKMYNDIKKEKKDMYLILVHPSQKSFSIHLDFFKEIIRRLSIREDTEMKKIYQMFQTDIKETPLRDYENKKEYEIHEAKCSHLYLFDKENPFYEEYKQDFEKINYNLPKSDWKFQFYQHFCSFDKQNYNQQRTKLVHNYLESLQFTLKYYNQSCPSWTWHYRYRVPPLFSDVYSVLEKQHFDMNRISFPLGKPFTPIEQLFLILPIDSFHLLPSKCYSILTKYKKYYPLECRVDAAIGLKFIYSEAILPEFDCFLNFLSDIRQMEVKLTNIERDRFKNINQVYKFT